MPITLPRTLTARLTELLGGEPRQTGPVRPRASGTTTRQAPAQGVGEPGSRPFRHGAETRPQKRAT